MNIQEYIQSVIEQLVEAVKSSQEKYCNGCNILPPIINPSNLDDNNKVRYNNNTRQAEMVRFTITTKIADTNASMKSGSLGIKVANGTIEDSVSSQSQDNNSISFAIPVVLPAIEENKTIPPKRCEVNDQDY